MTLCAEVTAVPRERQHAGLRWDDSPAVPISAHVLADSYCSRRGQRASPSPEAS